MFSSRRNAIIFADMLFLMMVTAIMIAFFTLPLVNPKAKAEKDDTSSPPGVVSVEAIWPPSMDADIDLWVQAPGDIPVGYSNKGGAIFNLLRDDLGNTLDLSGLNYENAYSRGVYAGKYIVNLHFYRNRAGEAIVPVKVFVSVKNDTNGTMKKILMSEVKMDTEGEEVTVFRFELDDKGELVKGSVDQLQTELRTYKGNVK